MRRRWSGLVSHERLRDALARAEWESLVLAEVLTTEAVAPLRKALQDARRALKGGSGG
jgi:hypothetical protein